MLVHRIAGGLHHKNIDSAYVLEQLKVNFAVGKSLQLGVADFYPNVLADSLRELGIRCAAEELEALVFARLRAFLRSGAGLSHPCLWLPHSAG